MAGRANTIQESLRDHRSGNAHPVSADTADVVGKRRPTLRSQNTIRMASPVLSVSPPSSS
jgi:hypothetical protein